MYANEERSAVAVPGGAPDASAAAGSGTLSAGEELVQLRRRPGTTAPGVAPAPVRDERSPVDLERLVHDIHALETIIHGWDDPQKGTVRALQHAMDALYKEALVRLIRALRVDAGAAALLRSAAADPVVYGVLRHLGIVRASLHERVEDALESVRPFLASHGGNVELVDVAPPDTVTIRLVGACDGCAASGLTLRAGVEKAIKEHCPEIRTIKKAQGASLSNHASGVSFVSPFARSDDAGWIRAASLVELPMNDILAVVVDGRSLLLARFEGGVSCFDNACAHLGMPLDMGEVIDGILVCPHHHFQYALDSGDCLTAPGVQLHAHGVRVTGGEVEVKVS
ncbi:MAG TPA: NifU family protein [Polyangiaceae bacterium]|jgi:Fe-S cluster biogenesis protein NfuA/nitrite reductase/ring-hydroxylating ferredoxin subunit